MSDGQFLFIILCLIYVTDCFVWLNKHSIAFCSWWCRRWKVKTVNQYFGSSGGSLFLLNPFPPLGRIFSVQLLPVSISPNGITAYNSQTISAAGCPEQKETVVLFEDIREAEAHENNLYINKELFCRCRVNIQAKMLASVITLLHSAKDKDRLSILENFLSNQFNLENAKKEYTDINRKILALRILCNILFVYFFVIVPLLCFMLGLTRALIPSAIIMFISALQVSIEYYHVHKVIFSELQADRVSNIVKMILCPPVAVRACDLLTAYSMVHYNPLTLASLLLSGSDLNNFYKKILRDLIYPITNVSTDAQAIEINAWQNTMVLNMATQKLPDVAHFLQSITIEPKRESNDCLSYCPRCLNQYVLKNGNCSDCLGVPLKSFSLSTNDNKPDI